MSLGRIKHLNDLIEHIVYNRGMVAEKETTFRVLFKNEIPESEAAYLSTAVAELSKLRTEREKLLSCLGKLEPLP